jgi:hypothetical protein
MFCEGGPGTHCEPATDRWGECDLYTCCRECPDVDTCEARCWRIDSESLIAAEDDYYARKYADARGC